MMKSVIASALALVAISQPLFAAENIADLEKAARGEGQLQSVGMPDSWANWKDTWQQLGSIYGIKHQDTDMSSAQEIAKFAAEKANATADIGDVGGTQGRMQAALCLHHATEVAHAMGYLCCQAIHKYHYHLVLHWPLLTAC